MDIIPDVHGVIKTNRITADSFCKQCHNFNIDFNMICDADNYHKDECLDDNIDLYQDLYDENESIKIDRVDFL